MNNKWLPPTRKQQLIDLLLNDPKILGTKRLGLNPAEIRALVEMYATDIEAGHRAIRF